MLSIEVNGQVIQARVGEMLLATLKRAGIHVPTLCHMDDLFPTGACRMCVVEVEGESRLVPSCAFPVEDGMKVRTHSPRAIQARKTIIELLLADHPDDCLYCVRNGNCRLQTLAEELGVRQRRYPGVKSRYSRDVSSSAIVRDPEKCILCGKCVRTCEEIQGVSAIDFVGRGSQTHVASAFEDGLNVSSCVHCGQCVNACPTGALHEKSHVEDVLDALNDPTRFVVVQHAPSVSVSLGEEFGVKPGVDLNGAMVAALRGLGFDRVFDTAFAADLTVMEEAAELVQRLRRKKPLPMLSSCSPGWVKFLETFYPEYLPCLSTCKSPQQMLGAVVKRYFAKKEGRDPESIYSVSIMPCTAKKFEARRSEMRQEGVADIDAVLTTRELGRIIRMRGLDLSALSPEQPDSPFGMRSTAGKLFGAGGGVAEAVLRTAYMLWTKKELPSLKIAPLRGRQARKELRFKMGSREIGVASVSGLAQARALLEELRAGRDGLDFIEVMACPGGCINGGGQPIGQDQDAVQARMQALYGIDRGARQRTAHGNAEVQRLYEEWLGEPLGDMSMALLHTHYKQRDVVK